MLSKKKKSKSLDGVGKFRVRSALIHLRGSLSFSMMTMFVKSTYLWDSIKLLYCITQLRGLTFDKIMRSVELSFFPGLDL